MNRIYDALPNEHSFKDYAFSQLTNAGALIADDSPMRHVRLFCTRWNGLDKSGGMADGTRIFAIAGIRIARTDFTEKGFFAGDG